MAVNIKNFVIDASYLLSVLFPDEATGDESKRRLATIINLDNKFFAPRILEFEVCNSIRSVLISKRFDKNSARQILIRFNKVPINYLDIDRKNVLDLSIKNNLSFYDASYLYLAKANKYRLLTLDTKLSKMLQ